MAATAVSSASPTSVATAVAVAASSGGGGEVGISPVLLQAITQTLSTAPATKTSEPIIIRRKAPIKIEATSPVKSQPHILSGMHEPIATSGNQTVLLVPNNEEQVAEEQIETVETTGEVDWTTVESEAAESSSSQDTSNHAAVSFSQPNDINMGSVLSAIASHFKNKGHSIVKQEQIVKVESEPKLSVVESFSSQRTVGRPVIVSEPGEDISETLVVQGPSAKKSRIELADHTNTEPATFVIHKIGENSYVDANTGEPIEVHNMEGDSQLMLDSGNSFVLHNQGNGLVINNQEDFKPCPICGDKISGYHYGTFTCESCKGFFKRTVQNKKSFICHRKGDCEISLANRKKCPSCRFKQCLLAGMRLEAIRTDRQRGGRSSYDGCSPHGRPKPPGGAARTVAAKTLAPRPVTSPYSGEKGLSAQPRTPQLLDDLTAIETLMSEDDNNQSACCVDKLTPGDTDVFGSLLHFADHCLYKIVRWARNLPDFSGVSTDDQILLLQNCWGELLVVTCCWQSMHAPASHLRLCHGRVLSLEQAAKCELTDLITRLIDFAGHMRRLEVDQHEFVALKVLMLLSPDVRNLHDEHKIQIQQEKISDALMIYTTTHYPDKPNKFCELLARLAELSRTVVQGKDLLRTRQAQGEVPQCSLLSELLKGDVVVMSS